MGVEDAQFLPVKQAILDTDDVVEVPAAPPLEYIAVVYSESSELQSEHCRQRCTRRLALAHQLPGEYRLSAVKSRPAIV